MITGLRRFIEHNADRLSTYWGNLSPTILAFGNSLDNVSATVSTVINGVSARKICQRYLARKTVLKALLRVWLRILGGLIIRCLQGVLLIVRTYFSPGRFKHLNARNSKVIAI